MKYGRGAVPKGMLPVFSVNSEEAAKRLLVMACERNTDGDYVARELAHEQTLENLYAFGDRLRGLYRQHHKYIETGKAGRTRT